MCTDRYAAIQRAEAVRAVERYLAPLGIEAVDPVEAAERIGDADGEMVDRRLAVLGKAGGVGAVALEGKLLHDGVADELPVEVDLGAEARRLLHHGGASLR